jgi:uncharacterized membrane protein
MSGIESIFSTLCGQNPAHTWAPGGELLPLCQRCTGLYAGACLVTALHLSVRPRLTGRFLWVHGLFLLLMVPFGYHWVAQESVLRTITGLLFGAGVVTFLLVSLKPDPPDRPAKLSSAPVYVVGLVLIGMLILILGTSKWLRAGEALTFIGAVGLVNLLVMVVLNAVHYLMALWRLAARPALPTSRLDVSNDEHLSPAIHRGRSSLSS